MHQPVVILFGSIFHHKQVMSRQADVRQFASHLFLTIKKSALPCFAP